MSLDPAADLDRIFAGLEIHDCWTWKRGTDKYGYGWVSVGSKLNGTDRRVRVHRHVYLSLTGEDLEDLVLDHLCRNTRCANPDHLEPVKNGTNVLRGYGRGAHAARMVVCKRGHELRAYPGSGKRYCPTCRKAQLEERQALKREEGSE